MPAFRLHAITVTLIVLLLFLQYRLWFEKDGIADMRQLKNALTKQTKENEKLKKMNEELLSQVQRSQNSKDATEARARNELGMIKRNETFYQVVK